jgi:hypothetical protein
MDDELLKKTGSGFDTYYDGDAFFVRRAIGEMPTDLSVGGPRGSS